MWAAAGYVTWAALWATFVVVTGNALVSLVGDPRAVLLVLVTWTLMTVGLALRREFQSSRHPE